MFRHLMSFQMNTRIASPLPASADVFGKTGSLFGVAANEVGSLSSTVTCISWPRSRAGVPYEHQDQIIPAIGTAVAEAVERLQSTT
jgi:hypothetical protein